MLCFLWGLFVDTTFTSWYDNVKFWCLLIQQSNVKGFASICAFVIKKRIEPKNDYLFSELILTYYFPN